MGIVMEYAGDLLEDEDYLYSGLDRILFLSCRQCFRYTPFLIYLPPPPGASTNEPLVRCAGCLPENLTAEYPSTAADRLISNKDFLRLIQGFEYSNPFYRRYAQHYRTLITVDTRLKFDPTEFENLSLFERLHRLQEHFPTIHLMQNKRHSGLEEITVTLATRNEIIRNHYQPKVIPTRQFTRTPAIAGTSKQLITEDISLAVAGVASPSVPVVAPSARLRVLSSDEESLCDICLLSEKNTVQFGPFIEKPWARDVLRCHYFCLLSGTHITQRGKSDFSGVLGFLLTDVKQSFVHYREKLCYCCGQKSAPIKCVGKDCDRYFHYICGYRQGCLTQFAGEYHSYCHEHVPINQRRHHPQQKCWVCWDELPEYDPVSNFYSICEPDETAANPKVEYSWYHRDCLQRYAYEAGYYFKCPHCHEKDQFPNYARMRGIFVPMRDASWELDQTYFRDLHGCSCSAENCKYANSKGKAKTDAQMVGCKACGGETLHLKCAEIDDPADYVCSKCMDATFIKLF